MVLIPQQGLPSLDLLVHSKRLVLRCPEDPPRPVAVLTVQYPPIRGRAGGISSSTIQRTTGVPSRGAVLTGNHPLLML
jgi:hypothetical protein